MGRKLPRSINLVQTINPPGDTFTIFYDWTFAIGKYLLVFIQIIIIVVFLMRLSVDRINNDLTMDINSQVDFLMQKEFRENEGRYRGFQMLFDDIDILDSAHEKNAREIVAVLDSIPNNVELLDFSFSNDRVGANFIANSLDEVKSYESFLKQNPKHSNVRLNLEKKGVEESVIEFSVAYDIVKGEEAL